jgi:hypothetical protein
MPEPLTRTELDRAIEMARANLDGVIGPQELIFHASCHPDWPTWTRYEDGVLIITCSQDKNEVTRIAVG